MWVRNTWYAILKQLASELTLRLEYTWEKNIVEVNTLTYLKLLNFQQNDEEHQSLHLVCRRYGLRTRIPQSKIRVRIDIKSEIKPELVRSVVLELDIEVFLEE